MSISYKKAYEDAVGKLEKAGINDAKIDAFYLLEYATGISKTDFILKKNELAEDAKIRAYEEYISRRIKHEPCQYITGSAWFAGLEFKVNESVLIPRQDTETLLEKAFEVIRENHIKKVLDLCTGSGALAISVKKYFPECEVDALDISKEAIYIAKENAEFNGVKINFILSDIFEKTGDNKYDMIISNPPYVTEDEYEGLMPEVKNFEPKTALYAGKDGLDFYEKISREAGTHLISPGFLLLEIGCMQAKDVRGLLENNGFENINVIKDLSGNDRVIHAQKPG